MVNNLITLWMSVQMYREFENPYFSCILLDISLIIALISLKPCMCIDGICMEGSMSQNFELGLSFCFMVCRRRNLGKNTKNSQKFPVSYHKNNN